ncbi:MAG: hypothetical protein EA385_13850, partial [Salinarimonadaceae bacterium]
VLTSHFGDITTKTDGDGVTTATLTLPNGRERVVFTAAPGQTVTAASFEPGTQGRRNIDAAFADYVQSDVAGRAPNSVTRDSFTERGMDPRSATLAHELYGSMRANGYGIAQSWDRAWGAYAQGYRQGGAGAAQDALRTTVPNPPAASQRQPAPEYRTAPFEGGTLVIEPNRQNENSRAFWLPPGQALTQENISRARVVYEAAPGQVISEATFSPDARNTTGWNNLNRAVTDWRRSNTNEVSNIPPERAGPPAPVADPNAAFVQRARETLGSAPVGVDITSPDLNPAIPQDNAWNNFWNWANPLPRLLGTDDARTNAWTARPRAVLDRINSEAGLSGDQRIAMNDDGVVNLPNSREGGQVLASMFYAQDGLHGSHNNAYGQFDIDELARQQGLSPDFVAGFNSARRQILNGEALAAGQTLAYGLAAAAPRLAGTPRVSTNVRLPGSTMQSGAPTHATANAPRIPIVRTVPNSPASPASPAPGNVRLNPGAAAAPPTGAGGLPPATARPQIPAQTGIDARNATIDVPATVIPNTPSVGSPAPVGQRRLPGTPPPSIPDVRTSDSIVRPAAPVLQFPNAPGVAPPGVAAPGASPALPATGLPGSLSTTPRPAPVVPAPTAPNLGNAGAARPRPVAPNTLAPNAAAPNPAASSAIPLATTPQPAVTPQTGSLQTGSAQTQPLPQSGPATAVRDRPAPTLQFETPTTPGTLANGGSANVAPPAAASATGDGATGNATPGAPTTPLATPGAPPAPTIPGAGAPIGLSGANPSPTPPVPPSGAGAPVTPDTDALNAAGDSEPTTDNVDGAANNPPRNPPISLSPQNPEPGDSSAITPSTQTGRPGTSGTQIEAFETGIPPIDPSDIQVGRTRAAPATANPATPARIAEAVRAANPDAEVQLVHGGTIAEVTYVSGTGDRAQTRTALVGNYQDIRDYNPELARAANQYLPNQSLLYDGRSPESVDQVFEGADISVMIADPAGRPIGMANLTYQTALYRDGSTGPVLYLAQVAGERGGGSQATAMLHDIARAEGTSMTASAFPGNVWNPPSERFPGGRSGLYGPNPSPGNPEPDAMIAWQASDTNPIDANGVPNPPRISLNPDRFGPDQPLTANPDGTSIFAPMHPFPVEPFPQNLGTAHGRPLTQTYENGMYSVRLGDDPNPVASAGRPFSIEQFEQAGSRPRQALDARAEAAGIATGDPTLAFVPEQNPTIDPGTSLRNADRVKYTWLYGAEDPDNLSVDDLPAFVFLDDRLGDQPIRHPFDPNQPDRPGNPNRPSSVFGQPYPDQPPANHAGPQSNISGPEGAASTIIPQGQANAPTITTAGDLAPRVPSNIDELVPPITGESAGAPVTTFDFNGNLNMPTDPNSVSLFSNPAQSSDPLSFDSSVRLPLFGAPANDGPMINSAADLQPRIPDNLAEIVPPEILASGTLNDMPEVMLNEAAVLSEQTGIPFAQRLADGRYHLVEYVGDTWRPIADFRNEVLGGAQGAALEAWDAIPAPMQRAIRTTGTVLGAVVDPIGTAFGAGVRGLNYFLETPAGQSLSAPLRNVAHQAGEAWEALGEHPQGAHIVNVWNNSLGHPRMPQLLGNFAQGSGRAVQTIANGGLGLLAAGIATGETQFGTFTSDSPSELPPELAQIYRQIAIVPRGVDIHYATVPVPGTPNGNVTIWTAGTPGMALRPGLPGEVGTAQPTVASTRNPTTGQPEYMGWVNFVGGGPTQWGGIAVNLTDNIGIQRSAFAQLGSGVLQTPVVRGSTGTGPYRFDQDRAAPIFEPTIVGSLAATRFGVTDEVRFLVPLGGDRGDLPINILSTRMRVPIRPTTVGTVINQNPATGNFGLRPQGNIDFNAQPNPAGLTVYGTQGGYNPNADDWAQIRQMLGLDQPPAPEVLPEASETP